MAKPALKPLVEAAVVLTSRGMHFLYYVGDYDFAISKNLVAENNGEEFSMDARTGLPVVGTAESVGKILECYSDGVVVVEVGQWRSPLFVTDEAADAIEAATEPIAEIPPQSQIKAFRWQRRSKADRRIATRCRHRGPGPLRQRGFRSNRLMRKTRIGGARSPAMRLDNAR